MSASWRGSLGVLLFSSTFTDKQVRAKPSVIGPGVYNFSFSKWVKIKQKHLMFSYPII